MTTRINRMLELQALMAKEIRRSSVAAAPLSGISSETTTPTSAPSCNDTPLPHRRQNTTAITSLNRLNADTDSDTLKIIQEVLRLVGAGSPRCSLSLSAETSPRVSGGGGGHDAGDDGNGSGGVSGSGGDNVSDRSAEWLQRVSELEDMLELLSAEAVKAALLGIIRVEKTARSGGAPADSTPGSQPDSTCASLHGNSVHGNSVHGNSVHGNSTSLHGVHGVSQLHPSVISLARLRKTGVLANDIALSASSSRPFPEAILPASIEMQGAAGTLAGRFGSCNLGSDPDCAPDAPGAVKDEARTATSPASTDPLTTSFGGMLIPIENVVIQRRIGNGGASTTYKASLKPDGRAVAIKVADPAADSLEQWKSEVRFLTHLDHPNIVRYIGCITSPPTFGLVLEYCPDGDLYQALRKPTPASFLLHVSRGLASALTYLHGLGLMHRDIKSPNVLMARPALDAQSDEGNQKSSKLLTPKLTDFGVAKEIQQAEHADQTGETGTYRWMAPEVIRHERYSSEADVYSWAMVMYELITHHSPFGDRENLQAATLVALENRRPALPPHTPTALANLINRSWYLNLSRSTSPLLSPSRALSPQYHALALPHSPSRLTNVSRCTEPSKRPPTQELEVELDAIFSKLTAEETKWLDAPHGHPVIDRSKQRQPRADRELAHVDRGHSVRAAHSDRDDSVRASCVAGTTGTSPDAGASGGDAGASDGDHRGSIDMDDVAGAEGSSLNSSPRPARPLTRMIRKLWAPNVSGASHKRSAHKPTSDVALGSRSSGQAEPVDKDESTCPVQ